MNSAHASINFASSSKHNTCAPTTGEHEFKLKIVLTKGSFSPVTET